MRPFVLFLLILLCGPAFASEEIISEAGLYQIFLCRVSFRQRLPSTHWIGEAKKAVSASGLSIFQEMVSESPSLSDSRTRQALISMGTQISDFLWIEYTVLLMEIRDRATEITIGPGARVALTELQRQVDSISEVFEPSLHWFEELGPEFSEPEFAARERELLGTSLARVESRISGVRFARTIEIPREWVKEFTRVLGVGTHFKLKSLSAHWAEFRFPGHPMTQGHGQVPHLHPYDSIGRMPYGSADAVIRTDGVIIAHNSHQPLDADRQLSEGARAWFVRAFADHFAARFGVPWGPEWGPTGE